MKFIITGLFLLSSMFAKSENKYSDTVLFTSRQMMEVYVDSIGKFELSTGWQKKVHIIIVDFKDNIIKIASTSSIIDFTNLEKKYAYKADTSITMIYYTALDKDGKRCNIRMRLQKKREDLFNHASYLYVDYSNVTFAYQMFIEKPE
jgi:hypothetical protein